MSNGSWSRRSYDFTKQPFKYAFEASYNPADCKMKSTARSKVGHQKSGWCYVINDDYRMQIGQVPK